MNLVPIKINRWDDATDFQYRFGCHRRRQSRKMEGNSGWFGLNKREYKLEISSLFHFRQKSAKNQKNNESFRYYSPIINKKANQQKTCQ